MAYSNFELLHSNTGDGGIAVGVGGSGLAVVNSGLSNPSTGSGIFCRYNVINGGGAIETAKLYCITAATDSGAFVNIPQTKGIEIIFSARGTVNSGFTNGTSVGVFVKNINLGKGTNAGFFGTGPAGEGHFGYGLRLSNLTNYSIGAGSLHVGLWARNANSGQQSTVTSLPVTGAVIYNRWYTLKFTCTPSGGLQDDLRAYVLTGSDINNPEHFTEIAALTIQNLSPQYIPWSTPTSRTGFYFSRGSDTNAGSADLAGHGWFIDRMSYKLKLI